MKVLPCKLPTYFDVDDTLIMWNLPAADDPDVIEITCPTSRTQRALQDMSDDGSLTPDTPNECVSVGSWTQRVKPHKKHIEALKQHYLRGHTVIVWSAGGWEWAEAAVRALGLQPYVHLVIEKPTWYYDDLQANEILGKRYYLKDE
jgi:phosphoserine phosphatase